MVKAELIKRSPLRLLEKSIHGELKPGAMGVLASRKGVGKTACLVHIATDQLFQNKHVIHVSFAGRTDHIISWYEDIFREIAEKRQLDDAMAVHDGLIKNRVIMNFSQEGATADQVITSLKAMITDGHFDAHLIVVDGYDFEKGEPETLKKVKAFAAEEGIAVWFSASIHREQPETDENGLPKLLSPYGAEIDVLITLEPTEKHVKLKLVKDYDKYPSEDLHLKLDSKSLLIAEE
ncbi:MAG: hypothetical protein ACOC25_02860 [Alkalispirochaetaceae bacterium]